MNQPLNIDYTGLNPQQLEAVQTISGPILVLAGAGTGKTRVITYRIVEMIRRGIAPEAILAVTFTNKAAREMKERVAGLVPRDTAAAVTISTFHSFCAGILRRHVQRLGYTGDYDIAVESYQTGLIRTLLGELGLLGCSMTAPDIASLISRAKTALLTPAEVGEQADAWPPWFAELYRSYQRRLKAMNMVDFDDLLMLVARLWREHPDILATHRQMYRYLMIDEYQDTNSLQLHLMKALAGEAANICVVGDDDQSIYGWRGADIGNILQFGDHFPGAKIIRLEQNYRSTNVILEAANGLIANNRGRHGKRLWSGLGQGEKILVVEAVDGAAEAGFVADYLRDRQAVGGGFDDFAVLYRSNQQSRELETALKKSRIPYKIVGGKSFFQRREVMDAISLLRVVNNPLDDQSLLRVLNVPPRGVGDKAFERLRELQIVTQMPLQALVTNDEFLAAVTAAAGANIRKFFDCVHGCREQLKRQSLSGAIREFFGDVGYLDGLIRMYKPRDDAMRRRENVFEFINAAAQFEQRTSGRAGLHEFLLEFSLLDDNDRDDRNDIGGRGYVSLMTVHAAKGLEFPHVLVVGMENGLFPHHNASLDGRNLDEERRLFYVAVTRARSALVLCHARKRMVNGHGGRQRKSPFLFELDAKLITEETTETALKPVSREQSSDFFREMRTRFANG